MKKEKESSIKSLFIPVHEKVKGITIKIHFNNDIPNQEKRLARPTYSNNKKTKGV